MTSQPWHDVSRASVRATPFVAEGGDYFSSTHAEALDGWGRGQATDQAYLRHQLRRFRCSALRALISSRISRSWRNVSSFALSRSLSGQYRCVRFVMTTLVRTVTNVHATTTAQSTSFSVWVLAGTIKDVATTPRNAPNATNDVSSPVRMM